MTPTASDTSKRSHRAKWEVAGIILLVFALAIILLTLRLRSFLVPKIVQQDGIALAAGVMVSPSLTAGLSKDDANDPEVVLADMSSRVVAAAQQHDVIGVRVFDRSGALQLAIGRRVSEDLSEKEIETLQVGTTITRFEPKAALSDYVDRPTDTTSPLVHSIVPLHHDPNAEELNPIDKALALDESPEKSAETFIGAAEFTLDGREVAARLHSLDRDLWLYGTLIFFLGGGVTVGAVFWAFGRLERANKLLAERTNSLLRANHELTLASKTSAIGAITAHLIHDLKNPLFGLQSFVTARGSTEEEDWNIAQSTTERMQKVIGEIVRILQEEKTTEKYELSIPEVFSLLKTKLHPQCASAGINFWTECHASGSVMNRDANIIILVITNIVQNAIQATPRGGEIGVCAKAGAGALLFTIGDTGPGLPEHIKATLFTPSRSTKSNGTGLGLAISKQLANHIGAELLLKETSRSGTVFELRVPDRVLMAELV